MQPSIVKRKLRQGKPILSVKLSFQDPAIYELVALLGFDCIWICNEHVGIDPSRLDHSIRACRAGGADALVRVKPSRYPDLLYPLESGAKGIMLPRVKEPEEVRKVIEEMKFYPAGQRGCDGVNAEADFGLTPLSEYLRLANDNNFLVVQVEEPSVLEYLDEIAALPGVDILFIGPGDLSIKLGIPGDHAHPKMEAVCRQVLEACRKHGKAAGIPCASLEQLNDYRAMGFQFLNFGGDYRCIKQGFERIKADAKSAGFEFRA